MRKLPSISCLAIRLNIVVDECNRTVYESPEVLQSVCDRLKFRRSLISEFRKTAYRVEDHEPDIVLNAALAEFEKRAVRVERQFARE